jgi:hypothetical protein
MDDDGSMELEDELRAAAGLFDPVPPELLEDAMRAYALRELDAELAELTFDSWDEATATRVRGAGAPRLLTFTAGELVVEVEVTGGRLVGRLSRVPEQMPAAMGVSAEIGVQRRDGERLLRSDELGRFTAAHLAPGPLRLRVDPSGDAPVVTSWVRI